MERNKAVAGGCRNGGRLGETEKNDDISLRESC